MSSLQTMSAKWPPAAEAAARHARQHLGVSPLGVPQFHNFRHTRASELLANGKSIVYVAARIGDSKEVVL